MSELYPVPNYGNFINYAHRGASEYAPENTMISFDTGVFMGANGIETDVQRTRDGVLVLFHDDTLERVTGEKGSVSDYSWDELRAFRVTKGELSDRIVRLDDFLDRFGWRDLTFAIELKVPDTEEDVAALLREYRAEEKAVITSFRFESVCRMREIAPRLRCGFLCVRPTDGQLARMLRMGFYEICPKATDITADDVDYWHRLELNVRAWGVKDADVMRRAVDMGTDGMTVNFPDKLTEYIREKRG